MPETEVLCRVCGGATRSFGVEIVLGRFEAAFVRCDSCGAIVAAEPNWLSEAYTEAIARRDIGLVSRNVHLAKRIDRILAASQPTLSRGLDFGAGNGMFVRMMRDRGYDFRYSDRYGPNLFAQGFELEGDGFDPEVVTALEVVEHLIDPVAELRNVVSEAEVLVVSTLLVPEPPPPLRDWWYYSLESGQHITLFTARALQVLAEQLGFHVVSLGSLHVMSRQRPNERLLRAADKFGSLTVLRRRRRTSLLESDFATLFGDSIDGGAAR